MRNRDLIQIPPGIDSRHECAPGHVTKTLSPAVRAAGSLGGGGGDAIQVVISEILCPGVVEIVHNLEMPHSSQKTA